MTTETTTQTTAAVTNADISANVERVQNLLTQAIETTIKNFKPTRQTSLMVTKMEEAVLWLGAHYAQTQAGGTTGTEGAANV